MIKEIIFDFDGTVADSFALMMEIFSQNKADFGFSHFGDKEVEVYRQKGIDYLLKKEKVSPFKVAKIIKVGKKQIRKKINLVRAFEGVKDVLIKLKKRGFVLGVMSTNSRKNIELFLKRNEIDQFDYVVGKGSLFGKSRVIKNILKKRRLEKSEVLYIGDEVRDIKACRKLGIKIVAVTWGFSDKELLKKNKPDFLIEKPEKILEVINSLD